VPSRPRVSALPFICATSARIDFPRSSGTILVSWYSGGRLGIYADPAARRTALTSRSRHDRAGLKVRSPVQPNRRKLGVDDPRSV
jgi:hypothetical protein